ncbi:MAG: PspC domain-containing protein [Streptosporangiales bacterium]
MEQPAPPGGEPGAPAQAPGPGLQRSANNRVIGGVCGGLAEYTGVDPVVFRVTIAVLALVGGAGALFYGAAMLLVPDARTGSAPIDRVLHSRQHPRIRVAALLLVIVAGIIVAGGLGGSFGSGSLAIVIVAVLAALVAHRQGADLRGALGRLVGHSTPAQRSTPYAQTPPPAPHAPPAAATSQYVDLSAFPQRPAYAGAGPAPAAGERRRARSITWYVLLAAALVAAVVAVAQQQLGLPDDARIPLVAALTALGLGLVLSTWVGRARVTWIGVLLAIVLAGLTVVHRVGGSEYLNRVQWHPTTAAQLARQQPYRSNVSYARLNLTDLPLERGASYQARARIDAGRLEVIVPRGARVHVHARCDACRMDVLGQRAGFDTRVDRTFTAHPGRTGREKGRDESTPRGGKAGHRQAEPATFDLNLRADAGWLEVRRAA